MEKVNETKNFFLTFVLLFCNNFSFGLSFKNKKNFNFDKNNNKRLIFLNKNECFSFLKTNKIFFSEKEKIIIGNNHFIGFFYKNKFKMFYIVKSKDTLYSIAKYSGHNYYELSKFNSIKKPYKIIIGQKIWVGDFFINEPQNNCSIINLEKNIKKKHNTCEFFFKKPLNFLNDNIKYRIKKSKICFVFNKKLNKKNNLLKIKSMYIDNNWYWPVKNQNIKYFYNTKSGNKKIEISGFKGQPIFAASAGEVVFVTDLFKKYGQLIIIRHDKDYLSIYAFNNSVLVKQNDKVFSKQQIATMGFSSEKKRIQLYFEIRYKGESINPLNILPKINIKK